MHSGHRLHVVQQSDVGQQRERNEDSFGRLDAVAHTNHVSLYVVADGMGGHVAGEVASQVAVQTILSVFDESAASGDLAEQLRMAIVRANAEVYTLGNTDIRLTGMGTTVVAAAVSDAGLVLANVGDSRAYLLREGELQQLTRDHSWVARAVEDGVLTPAQARNHPDRNVIYRSLGAEPDVRVDTFVYDLRSGDRVLLCSDGLTDVVDDDLLSELADDADADTAVQRLIDAANDAGGPDNVTVTMIVVEKFEGESEDRSIPDHVATVTEVETPAPDVSERPTEPGNSTLDSEDESSTSASGARRLAGWLSHALRRMFHFRS